MLPIMGFIRSPTTLHICIKGKVSDLILFGPQASLKISYVEWSAVLRHASVEMMDALIIAFVSCDSAPITFNDVITNVCGTKIVIV